MGRLHKQLHIFRRCMAVLVALLIVAALLAPMAAAAPVGSGECGSLKWSLSGGVLSITGRGAIPDYTERNPAPWAQYKEYITRLDLGRGVTAIGKMAFFDHAYIRAVLLPNTVETVGDMAFAGCERMTTIAMAQVTTLGEYAFSRCFALDGVVLPNTLTTIGSSAFYRCESLSYIHIPASVTSVGSSVFAYCYGLLRADVEASVTILPEWFFYGCTKLSTLILPAQMTVVEEDAFTRCDNLHQLYYTGTDENRDNILEDIQQSLPNFTVGNVSSSTGAEQPPVKDTTASDGDIETKVTHKEVITDTDVVIRVEETLTHPIDKDGTAGNANKMDILISATVTGDAGWDALEKAIEEAEKERGSFELQHEQQSPVRVEIMLLEDGILSGQWLESMHGRNVIVTVITSNGSRWSIDCRLLKGLTFKKKYDLTYTLTAYDKVSKGHQETLGTAASYWLNFAERIDFPITVDVYIDVSASRQNATLYEKDGVKNLTKLQSVMVDEEGVASFYLTNVNKGERYIVALNVGDSSYDNPPIPESMKDAYGGDVGEFVPFSDRYIVSEVRGFLGMTMKDFTVVVAIVAAALILLIVIGVVIITLINRQRAFNRALRERRDPDMQ